MHAAVAGPDDGPLAILLHGFPQHWRMWRPVMIALAQAGLRVVAPDQRGYNLTEKTPPFDIATLVQDVIHLIDACGQRQACLAGHDWGAGVAWALASAHPERVKRLAILNVPHPAVTARALLGGNPRQMLRSTYILVIQIPYLVEWLASRNRFALMRRALIRTSRPGTFSEETLDHYVRAWSQPGALSAMFGWYRALFRAARPGTRQKYAQRIQAPTRILWGERDHALRAELADESAHWLEDGTLIRFPNATHWIVDEYPAEISRHLREHFANS